MKFNREKSSLLADSITRSLRGAMLEKDPAIVRQMLGKYDSEDGIQTAIFRTDGSRAYGDIDWSVPLDLISSAEETTVQAPGSLIFLKPLFNEKECYACHGSQDRVRGVVAVRIPTAGAEKEVGSTAEGIAVFAALTALLSGAGLVFTIRRMISKPLLVLKEGTEKIRDGDLGHRIDMDRNDELGSLAVAFNQMMEKIEDGTRIYGNLKDHNELSDAIFDCTMSGVAVLDKRGTVMRINQAGSDILKLSGETIVGRKIVEVYPETKEMLVVGSEIGREVTVVLRDGVPTPIGFTNSPLFDKNGSEQGIVTVFRDLTEIKELQSEVRKKHHFESMGKIISGVAHEIRNPLFAIQSIAQLLEREIEHEQHQTLLGALLKETSRMRNLVDELLLYGKPSALNITDVSLGALMAELKEYCKAKDNKVNLSIKAPPLATIRADKDKLFQVFLNLLDNALGAGSTQVTIASEKAGSLIRILIKDNGAGIREQDLERIFDPFFTTKKEGTGLGLPICKKIIEDHGGSIEAQSQEGKGTTLMLTLRSGK